MLTLENKHLIFRFPAIEPGAKLSISLQRAMRVPPSGGHYPLSPNLGTFPLCHVEDYTSALPEETVKRGGVFLPVWQAEALWLKFQNLSSSDPVFPFAIKVAAGKVNVLTGEPWKAELSREPQDYMTAPDQRWLDGFAFGNGEARQFVAEALGKGKSVEEQLTHCAVWGGLQIMVIPLSEEAWRLKVGLWAEELQKRATEKENRSKVVFSLRSPNTMGLASGGFIHQRVNPDFFALEDWDLRSAQRIFITLVHAKSWKSITGEDPPTKRPTSSDYKRAGLPWAHEFDSDREPRGGLLAKLRIFRA